MQGVQMSFNHPTRKKKVKQMLKVTQRSKVAQTSNQRETILNESQSVTSALVLRKNESRSVTSALVLRNVMSQKK